ncbi:glycosyltransferase [Paenibacillus dokdonensis]|uniref:Glycosyltransferase n=1 Tax=Paenibacillus dokdonensis TaxID=2567944 RepID=A0ABU6GIK2_9BACL|nr:glycosyltransferase [Paenibacillus dokdonensis]MEC0239567.1 glycosyltransferase [Paenibacillus dokdonensis]
MSTIGIHLIVKDESDIIHNCLNSVKLADEIIVVDTGSQDDTILIAKQYGADVISVKWQHDFSMARNEALRYATTDWILVIDADEELLTSMDEIRLLIEESQVEAYDITIINLLSHSEEDLLYHRSLRLFRNRREYHFEGKIHEEIEPSILLFSGRDKIKDSGIEMKHTGYLPHNICNKNKLERNYHILMNALEEEPEHPYYLYHLGITHCQGGNIHEAKKNMLQAKQLAPSNAYFRPTLIKDLVKIMLDLNETQQAGLICLQETERYRDYADIHYLHGQCLEMQGLWERAFEAYRKAAECTSSSYVTEAGINSYKPLSKMGGISLKLQQPEEAARLFYEAIQLQPSYSPAAQGLATSFHRLHTSDEEISKLLLKIIQPRNKQQWSLMLHSLDSIGADEEIIRLCPAQWITEDEISALYGSSLIRSNKLKEAHSFFYHAASVNPASNSKREMLHLITQWQLLGSLEPHIWAFIHEHKREPVERIDRLLFQSLEADSQHETVDQKEEVQLIHTLIQQSISIGLTDLARRLSVLENMGPLTLAKALYREGYVLDSADLFISLLEVQVLDDEGAHMLAEILYDKGHYMEAVRLFENITLNDPSLDQASIGAAVCYLHLAADYLEQAHASLPGTATLLQEAHQLRSALRQLERSGWHMSWDDRQRRCIDEQKLNRNLPLHDRPE